MEIDYLQQNHFPNKNYFFKIYFYNKKIKFLKNKSKNHEMKF